MLVIVTVIAVARRQINHLRKNLNAESNKHPQTANALPHIGLYGLNGGKKRVQVSIQALVDDVCHGRLVQLAQRPELEQESVREEVESLSDRRR